MKSKSPSQIAAVNVVANIVAIAMLTLGLSACSNHHSKENCCTDRGNQFLGKRTVKMVYESPEKEDEPYQKPKDPPISIGDEYEIVRESENSNVFEFVPGGTFRGDRGNWGKLKLKYMSGNDADKPIALIAEICGKEKDSRGVTIIDVQNDYINLVGRGLEFLQGTIELDGDTQTIHIFHIEKAKSGERTLLIFYCDAANCNHNGMVD